MGKPVELPYNMLKNELDPSTLSFDTTADIEPLNTVIGQKRAIEALEFGLQVKIRGYNIYMSGASGTGKTSYAQTYIKSIAKEQQTPDDWCYVYNFAKPANPVAINLPAGKGIVFQKDMDEFVEILEVEITRAFESEDYEKEKAEILQEYQKRREQLLEQLSSDAEKHGFKVKTTNSGIYFLPIVEGKTLTEQDYGQLDDETKSRISKASEIVQRDTYEVIRKIKNVEREAEEKISEWENRIALFAVGMNINDLKEKYKDYPKVVKYLEDVQEDILDNLDEFRTDDKCKEQRPVVFPWLKNSVESLTDKYRVNLLVDNSKLEGAPVVIDFNPTYYNLMGKQEYENEFGTATTDFSMIKSGLFHQANGGYLILQAKDVLNNIQSWEALKRVLKTRQISIENIKEQMGMVTASTVKPEPIPAQIKIILVGSSYLYQLLYEYDEDFSKYFKIKVDFDEEMDRNDENIYKLSQFISGFCSRENTPCFDRTAVARVVEYSSHLVEHQHKLSTRLNDIVEVLAEAAAWAEISGENVVRDEHVKKAIEKKKYRSNKYDQKLLELLEDGTIMVDTEGAVVGQINGLSVLDMGDYSFGKPSRITATTYVGKSGIVNIEREVEMSGTSHSKGVLILTGYLGQKYAQEIPLALSASLCFEQLYSGVDGDSASSTELYAILSSLSGLPIKQGIAVTGSVNQKGEIQPIGGVTEKIEGFYEICKIKGLTGEQGVMIPHQNIKNLCLSDEVIQAVKDGEFHIYPIKTIDEGIEILTGVKVGEKQDDGKYPDDTINGMVFNKLKHFAKLGRQKEAKKNKSNKK